MHQELMPGAVMVALIGYLESIAIGKAFARENKYRLKPSQELVAIGASNMVGSFLHAYPVTGSFSRTAVNSASGVATPLAGVMTGLIPVFALLFLTSALVHRPWG